MNDSRPEPRPVPPAESDNPLLSPGLACGSADSVAYEMKFLVSEDVARAVEQWACQNLTLDPFVDRERGCYRTTTLYLDTPNFDVLNRSPGFRKRKHRLRRYGNDCQVYLEQKTRKNDRVSKLRTIVHDSELARLARQPANGPPSVAWQGDWFHERVETLALGPACVLSYSRTAFARLTPAGVVRLTLDRNIRGSLAGARGSREAWHVPLCDGPHLDGYSPDLLEGSVVCELKFRDAMPNLFKQLVAELKLEPGSVSKYRRLMQWAGVTPTLRVASPCLDDSSTDLPNMAPAGV